MDPQASDQKEEIKRRTDLAALISRYVTLQRAGSRLKARCPFHQEKTPSFHVDPAAGYWKCFGCGAGGDAFSFLMKVEGLSFPEAGERLAREAGLPWRSAPGEVGRQDQRRALEQALDAAAEFFTTQLQGPAGAGAREYLDQRGLGEEIRERFGLGYAPPGWDNLARRLAERKIPPRLAEQAGLLKPRSGGGHYDVFRHRVIFPIRDAGGRVVGFGGRTLDPEEQAKYLNSADTPVFHKGQLVYGLPQARQALVATEQAVLVEGYTDVLALHQAGVSNVVAALGTALTEDHVRLLSRYVETIVLCYDADAAGMQAALRNLLVFEKLGVEAQVVVLPAGSDPDEFIRAQGPQGWERLLQGRLGLAEYQMEMVFSRYRGQGPESVSQVVRRVAPLLARIPDPARRDLLVRRAADRWGQGDPAQTQTLERLLRLTLASAQRGRQAAPPRRAAGRQAIAQTLAQQAGGSCSGSQRAAEFLLATALQHAEACPLALKLLCPADFPLPADRRLAAALLEPGAPPGPELVERLPEADGCRERAVELLLLPLTAPTEEEIAGCAANLRRYRGVQGVAATYEVPLEEASATAESEAEEDFGQLQTRVTAALARGELDYDHPDYQRYCRLVQRLRGLGGYDPQPPTGPLAGGPGARDARPEIEADR